MTSMRFSMFPHIDPSMKISLLALSSCLAVWWPLQAADHSSVVVLTWQGDTSTTMTVNTYTIGSAGQSRVYYDTEPGNGTPDGYRYQAKGSSHQIDGLEDRYIQVVELTRLDPGQAYYFITGNGENGFSEERKFRTLPKDGSPIRFVTGGDMGIGDLPNRLLRQAAAQEPHFSMIGGDIAYANGQLRNIGIWDTWLKAWSEYMITPDGFTIPLALAIGNHEVRGKYGRSHREAPFFFGLFAQNGTGSYFRRQFGRDMVVYFLDSGHVTLHEDQVPWLERNLQEDQAIPLRFAIYHVPLYPSHRDFTIDGAEAGRKYWAPLFDRYNLAVAFENHDHTFKVTHPLFDNQIADSGTLYLGDGCWGRGPRTFSVEPRWYLKDYASAAHFWAVDVADGSARYRAIDDIGQTFYVLPEDSEGAAEAAEVFQTIPVNYAIDPRTVRVEPLLRDREFLGRESVEVTVHNRAAVAADAVFRLEVQAPLTAEPDEHRFRLQPQEEKAIAFELDSIEPIALAKRPSGQVRYTIDYDLPGKQVRFEGQQPIVVESPQSVPTRSLPPVIDGRLDEWSNLPIVFEKPDQVAPVNADPLSGPDDFSLKFGIERNEELVFIAVRVKDDTLSLIDAPIAWNQDGLHIWINTYPQGNWDDDPLFALIPGATLKEGYYVQVESPPADLQSACLITDTGYDCEIAVPIAYLEKEWQREGGEGALEHLRFNIAVNDKDGTDDPTVRLFWRPRWDEPGDYTWSGVFRLD